MSIKLFISHICAHISVCGVECVCTPHGHLPLCTSVFPVELYNETSSVNVTDPYGGESHPLSVETGSLPVSPVCVLTQLVNLNSLTAGNLRVTKPE